MIKQRWLVLSLILGLAFTTLAWGEPLPKRYVIGDLQGDWGYPSPYAYYPRGPGFLRVSFLFDTLIWKDAKGYIPALAQSWDYEPQPPAYVFHLRPGVKWHDGQPLTAADVAFTVNYFKRHPHPWVMATVIKAVEVLDPQTVRLILTQPYAPFLEEIAGGMFILPRHIWQEVQEPGRFQEPRATIGSGPYRFAEYRREHGFYRFTAFDQYYQGKPIIPDLCFVRVGDPVLALKGQAVQAAPVPPEAVTQLKAQGWTIKTQPHLWVLKLLFNHQRFPMQKRAFRQALAYGLDLPDLVARAVRGNGQPGSPGLLPPDSSWYNPQVQTYPYDPARCRQLMTSLGYQSSPQGWQKDGKRLQLEILTPPSRALAEYVRVAEYLQKTFKSQGINLSLRVVDYTILDHRVRTLNFDLALSGHGGLGGDPKFINDVTAGPMAASFSGAYPVPPDLKELLQAQLHTLDKKQRRRLVNRIQQRLAEELPYLPLYYPTQYMAHDGRIQWFFTKGGIAKGIPIFFNKIAVLPPSQPPTAP